MQKVNKPLEGHIYSAVAVVTEVIINKKENALIAVTQIKNFVDFLGKTRITIEGEEQTNLD